MPPIIIIGAGLVGIRLMEELLACHPTTDIVIFGDEPYAPYDRLHLGKLLQANVSPDTLRLPLPETHPRLHCRFQQTIARIDPKQRIVHTVDGETLAYSQLVLATGATAFIPPIAGIGKAGVQVFRTIDDALAIRQQRQQARHIAVLGGGFLGIETASALLDDAVEIHIIERSDRLMNGQAHVSGNTALQKLLTAPNLHLHLNSGVQCVLGDTHINALELTDGTRLDCQMLVVAAGIRPNIALAQAVGLQTGRGICVDDGLQTSDPHIFAIGDCVEHRGVVYGLLAPGYSQAEALARRLSGEAVCYTGSSLATTPKLPAVAPQPELPIARWPEEYIICQCNIVTRGELSLAIRRGCTTIESLSSETLAGNNCGSCRCLMSELLGTTPTPQPHSTLLYVIGWIVILGGLFLLLFPGFGYQHFVANNVQWDSIWRDSVLRQISGFSLLGISALIAVISLRKRLRWFRWGQFASWRSLHVLIGLLVLLALLVHTGARFGENLNLLLVLSFVGVLLTGGLLAASIAYEHRLMPQQARHLRTSILLLHVLLLWPLPVLLIFHILKSYYF